QPALGMSRNRCVRDPLRSSGIVRQRRPLSAFASQCKALRHRIDEQLLCLEHDVVLCKVDGRDSADRSTGMLDSERTKSARRKDLEGLAVKKGGSGIFRLFVKIISQSHQTVLDI